MGDESNALLRAIKKNQPQKTSRPVHLAGVEGFEPPYGGIKTRCLTAWRHPNSEINSQRTRRHSLSRPITFPARASRSIRAPDMPRSPAAAYAQSHGRGPS